MTEFGPIAGYTARTDTNQVQLFAGESDIVTTQGELRQLDSGDAPIIYTAGQVLGRNSTTGIWEPHAPGASDGTQHARAILGYTPLPGGQATPGKLEGIYVGGTFNMDALTFNAATNTDAKKAAVFDGTNIVAQKLYGNPPAGSGPV